MGNLAKTVTTTMISRTNIAKEPAFPVGRLAPSPTGAQHVGNARTYLITWLSLRSRGGKVILRIEDIDSPRVKSWATDLLAEDLRWLGLDWDEGPIVQSGRLSAYETSLSLLKQKELVYPCTCSRSDVERAASAPHSEHEGPVYPGTCATRKVADAANLSEANFSWRFRASGKLPSFNDGFLGHVDVQRLPSGGDFVVWKSAGMPAYQLAVVVDDAAMGITEVVRGDDLVYSTPRQLLLYETLGLKPPHFIHVPLVVGPDSRRLAKRHGDTRLLSLRQAGVKAEMLIGLLAWSCGWLPEDKPISARELLPLFRLETIPREPFVFEEQHLDQIGYRIVERQAEERHL
jgi:glutamyl-tRNA synthetase